MGYRVVTPGVTGTKVRYGAVGTPTPLPYAYAAGPATAGPIVATPEAISGGNTQVIGFPGELVTMPVPITEMVTASGGSTPLESQRGYHANAVVSNQRYITPPSNTVVTPRIRPPKFVDPPIQNGNQLATAQAAFARGGMPRGSYVPQPWVTGSPQVVTRWDQYGAN